jgi:hypothetical protein
MMSGCLYHTLVVAHAYISTYIGMCGVLNQKGILSILGLLGVHQLALVL